MRDIFDDLKVVIVGAGLAGLSAAVTLHNCGVTNIAVLEAQSEAGGRVKTERFGSKFVDLGAQWFHGTNHELYKIAEKNDLLQPLKSFEGLGNYYRIGGEVVPPKIVHEVNTVVTTLLDNLHTESKDCLPESVGEYLAVEFNSYIKGCNDSSNIIDVKKELLDWNFRYQMIDNGCKDLSNLSSWSFGEYAFCGGENYVNFRSGFQSVVDILVDQLPPKSLFTSSPVKSIRWKENIDVNDTKNICEIVTEKGDLFLSEHIIVTCSVGFLKNNWFMFQPSLPLEYLKGFNCFGFDTLNKIYLEYEECWWENLNGIQLVWDSNNMKKKYRNHPHLWIFDLTGFDIVIGLPNVLVGWVGGEGAALMEKLSSDAISKHCTLILQLMTSRNDIPEPKNCIHSSWFSNMYIRGGYSYHTLDKHRNETVLKFLMSPVYTILSNKTKHPSILFAGEALHVDQYSTAHAAFESGKNQATKLVNYMKLS